MDIDQQIKVVEQLLKLPDNQMCAECPSKIPRWASITFGTFMCIRCSGKFYSNLKFTIFISTLGVHRQIGVHITKVKSVNLDKWPAGKVELFQSMSNRLANSYWEKNLPAGYKKPDSNASNREVTDFLTNKYVHKKWANTDDWSNDPAWLYENKPKKFQKYLQYYKDVILPQMAGGAPGSFKKGKKEDSSDDE